MEEKRTQLSEPTIATYDQNELVIDTAITGSISFA
jgi:hypothetical protein